MTDREEIIRGLQIERECVSMDCDRDCGKCDLVQERDWLLSVYDGAIALLKEQEPKLVKIDRDRGVLCPSCGNELFTYPQQKFCDECGQAVKWN